MWALVWSVIESKIKDWKTEAFLRNIMSTGFPLLLYLQKSQNKDIFWFIINISFTLQKFELTILSENMICIIYRNICFISKK